MSYPATLLFTGALFFCWSAISTQAQACTCGLAEVENAAQLLKGSKAVFEGVVKSTRPEGTWTQEGEGIYENRKIEFTVLRAWKGVYSPALSMDAAYATHNLSGTCYGYHFKRGKKYLIFTESDALRINTWCSPTLVLPSSDEHRNLFGPYEKWIEVLGKQTISFEE